MKTRNHHKVFQIMLSLILLSSCASTRFVAPDLEVIYTRKGENIGGVVVYNPHGIKQLVKARRDKAISRMREACDPGIYKITKEEIAKPGERNDKYKGNPEIFAGKTVMFLDFKCRYK